MYNDESGSGSDIDSFTTGILERATERRRLYSSAISSAPRASLTNRVTRKHRELKVDKEKEDEPEEVVEEKVQEVEADDGDIEDDDNDEELSEEESVPRNSPIYSRAVEPNPNPSILQNKSDRVKSEEVTLSSRRSSRGGRLSRLNALSSNINSWEDDLTHFVSSKSRSNHSPPKSSNSSGRSSPSVGSKSVLASNTSYSSSTNHSVRKSFLPVLGNQSVGGLDGGGGGSNNKHSSSPNTRRILDLELKKSPTSAEVTSVATARRLNFNKQNRQVEIITEKVGPNVWDKSILNSLEAQGFVVANPTKTKLTYEYSENVEPVKINSPKTNSPHKGPVDTAAKKLISPPKSKPVSSPIKSPIRTQVAEIATMETPRSGLSVDEKTALFESKSTTSFLVVEKDPTELTVAQRAKLFEKKAMIGNNTKAAPTGRYLGTGGKIPTANLNFGRPESVPLSKFRPSVSNAPPQGNVQNHRRLFETQLKGRLDSLEEVAPQNPPTNTRQLPSKSTTAKAEEIQPQQLNAMAPPAPPPMPTSDAAATTSLSRRSSVSPDKSSPYVSGSISPNRTPPHMGSGSRVKRSISPSSRSPSPKSRYPGARDVKRIKVNDPKPGHMYPSLTDIETETTETENEGEGDVDDMVIDNNVMDYDDADMDSETSMLSASSLGAQIERMAKAKVEEYDETPKPRRNPFHRRTEDFSSSLACRQIDAYIDEALEGQDFTLDTVIESHLNPQSSSTPKTSIHEEMENKPEEVWRVSEELSRRNSSEDTLDTLKAEQSSSGSPITTTAIEVQVQPNESPMDLAPENVIVQDNNVDTENGVGASAKKFSPVDSKQDSSSIVASSPLYSKASKNASPVGTPLMHTVSVYRKQQGKTMTPTPRAKLREDKVSPKKIPAPKPPTDKTSLSLLISKLDEEVAHQQRSIGQISKALSLCKSTVEFSDSTENVECERILLIATQKRTALLNEIHRLKTEGVLSKMTAVSPSKQDLSPTCRGTMTVSNVQVPHDLKNTNLYRTTATPAPDTVCHFICLARYRDQLEVSALVSIGEGSTGESIVRFPNSFSFKNLEPEFEIKMDFYVLRSRKEFLPHEAKYHINMKEKTPKKSKDTPKFSRRHQASPAGPDAVRTSNFKLCGSLVLNISNLGRSSYRLEGGLSPLEGSAAMEIECSAEDGVEERGFLTVFDDVAGFGAWHRRWCRLTPTELISYMYPEDEQAKIPNPHTVITLRNCVTSNVKPVDRETCARANTFMLVMSRPRRDTDKESLVTVFDGKNTYVKHLISADSKEERDLWCRNINRALANMRAWDPQCYSSKASSSF